MQFVIEGIDNENVEDLRGEFYPEHRLFLSNSKEFGVEILVSGPLIKDDGKTTIGSLFIIEAENRESAEKFHFADPFFKAGIWAKTTITAFIRRR